MTFWLVVYAALLFGSIHLIQSGLPQLWLVPVSLLPMIGGVGVLAAAMRRYRSLDEFQKRIVSEAIVFSFGCTAVLTFSYGFLENTAHAPHLNYFAVWVVMGSCWLLGTLIAKYRYR